MKVKLEFNNSYLRVDTDTHYPENSPEEGKCNNYNLRNNVRNPDIADKDFKAQQSIPYTVHNYTVSPTVEKAFAAYNKNGTSPHFLIDQEGEIFQFVPMICRAYHAGAGGLNYESKLNPHVPEKILANDMNSFSIGVNYVNTGLEEYTPKQLEAGLKLQEYLTNHMGSNPKMILGHSDWAPERKIGPGPYFPWQTFAKASEQEGIEHNFGFYSFKERKAAPEVIISYKDKEKNKKEDIESVQKQLEELGYRVLENADKNLGKLDTQTTSAMLAFKLHYMNQDILANDFLKSQWEALCEKSSNTEAKEAIAQWNENDQMVLGDVLDQYSEG